MKRYIFVLLVVMVGLFLNAPTAHALMSSTERITTNGTQQNGPLVHQNLIVWTDWRGTQGLDIWGYDLKTQTEFPIISDRAGNQRATDISEKYLVYSDYGAVDGEDVRILNWKTGEDRLLAGGPGDQNNGVINGNNVVYQDGYGYGDIFLVNIAHKTKRLIVQNASGAKISNRFIVWYTNVGSGVYEIGAYDYLADTFIEIPNSESASRSAPDVWQKKMVYGQQEADGISIRIFDLQKGQESVLYKTNNSAGRPVISQKYVVWSESPQQHANMVMAADWRSGDVITLQEEGPHQNGWTNPSIWNDKAVWMAWRTGNGDIYMSEIDK